jgi:shikimate kinase
MSEPEPQTTESSNVATPSPAQRNGLPPFLDESDPERHFTQIYEERAPHYRRLARLTVNLDGLDVDAALEKLCRELDRANQTTSP